MRRWINSLDKAGDRVIEEAFFDDNSTPATTRSGYAIIRRTENTTGQLDKVQLLSPSHQTTPSLRRVLRNSNGQPLILLRQIAVGNLLTSDWFFYQSKVPWTGRSGFNRSGLGVARSWAKHLSNATLSASKLMVQVNAKLLRKIASNPNWFFSNDCPASYHF